MKIKELRELSDEKLLKMKKDIEIELVKSRSRMITNAKDKYSNKKITKSGDKTSLTKNLKKYIARINTILNERK